MEDLVDGEARRSCRGVTSTQLYTIKEYMEKMKSYYLQLFMDRDLSLKFVEDKKREVEKITHELQVTKNYWKCTHIDFQKIEMEVEKLHDNSSGFHPSSYTLENKLYTDDFIHELMEEPHVRIDH